MKFKSAEAKKIHEENVKSWDKLLSDHTQKPEPLFKRKLKRKSVMPVNPRINELRVLPSLDSGHKGAVTTGVKPQVYTGDKIVGISVMHKSNLVPIFNEEAAKDIASMRR